MCFIGASMWHPFDATLHKIQVAYPLLIVLIGYVWAGMFELINDSSRFGINLLVPAIIVASNSAQLYFNLIHDNTKVWFRSRTNKLCEFLIENPKKTYLLSWDWDFYGMYFGDTNPEVWAKNPTNSGYDSWSCSENVTILPSREFLKMSLPEQLRLSSGVDYIILGTRFQDDASAISGLGTPIRLKRLRERMLRLSESGMLKVEDCTVVQSDNWHSYAVCPVTHPKHH
jgi:hypothetical protein